MKLALTSQKLVPIDVVKMAIETVSAVNTNTPNSGRNSTRNGRPGLKKIPPYWYPYRTNAKARWFDREILEVVSTEFRDRSVDGRREGETWMICTRRALGMWATRAKAGGAHLDDAVDPTSCGDDLAPIFVLTP